MQVTIDIPDALAAQLAAAGRDPAREMRETLLVEAYRSHLLNEGQIKSALGFGTRMQVHQLLQRHNVPLHYTEDHVLQDIAASEPLVAATAA